MGGQERVLLPYHAPWLPSACNDILALRLQRRLFQLASRVVCGQEAVLLQDGGPRLPPSGLDLLALRLQRRLPRLLSVLAQAVVRGQVGLVLPACWPWVSDNAGAPLMQEFKSVLREQ